MVEKSVVLARLKELGLVSVIRGPSVDLTIKMVEALVAGGVYAIEITYSTPNAAEVVKTLDRAFGDKIVLGMGTLTETRQAEEAFGAGAKFLVSPLVEAELGKAMIATGLATMIGALTPTEVFQAYRMGSDVVKIFPGNLVGPAYIKSLKAPLSIYPDDANRRRQRRERG